MELIDWEVDPFRKARRARFSVGINFHCRIYWRPLALASEGHLWFLEHAFMINYSSKLLKPFQVISKNLLKSKKIPKLILLI